MNRDDGAPAERPTAQQLATARRLRELHLPMSEPGDRICSWCLKRWPCPDKRWIERTLRGQVGSAEGTAGSPVEVEPAGHAE